MAAAAAELRFETAGTIKLYVEQLKQLGKGPLRHVRRLEDFAFVTLQRGPRAGTAKVFLVTAGAVEEVLGVVGSTVHPGQVLRAALEGAAERPPRASLDPVEAERLGVAAHHLFSGKAGGAFLRLETLDEKAIAKAFRELQKQPEPQPVEGEGVIKELQSL